MVAPPVARNGHDDVIVVAIRLGVVTTLGAVAFTLDPAQRASDPVVAGLVSIAAVYALALAAVRLTGAEGPPARAVTGLDAVLSLLACALTGGAVSLAVAILPLVVIAASLRSEAGGGELFALGLGVAFTGAGLVGSPAGVALVDRLLVGVWWTLYLFAVAALVGVFVRRLHREYRATAESRAEAIAEHEALVEERDLRRRLLDSQQARLDGLRVIVHEFRAPVTSLAALSRAAVPAGNDREAALGLIEANALHLQEMLDGLADVALSEGSPIGRAKNRLVSLSDLAEAVVAEVGLPPDRRACRVDPPGATVRCDPQRLRRSIRNLVENAARQSSTAPVEVHMRRAADDLVVEVRDRGPGVPADQLGLVTEKYVRSGDRRGTAGLGLWIVSQLTAAMGGTLALEARPGGGLVARLTVPMSWG